MFVAVEVVPELAVDEAGMCSVGPGATVGGGGVATPFALVFAHATSYCETALLLFGDEGEGV